MKDTMSVPKQNPQATFFDASFLAQDLFDSGDRYEIFRQEVYPALQAMRQELCQLYCADNGHPGLEPVLMTGVILLQFMENVPDRKAVEMVRLHLGWKHALNLRINYGGFHPTSLVTFRERLMAHKEGRIILTPSCGPYMTNVLSSVAANKDWTPPTFSAPWPGWDA